MLSVNISLPSLPQIAASFRADITLVNLSGGQQTSGFW
jgi:hypothetical protein